MPTDKQPMLYIGLCRICGTGPLGLRCCGGCQQVVVLCDECDAVWTNDKLDESAQPAFETALPCPHCDASLSEAPSHWASRQEVDACDWVTAGLSAGKFELQATKAFAPLPNPLQQDEEQK